MTRAAFLDRDGVINKPVLNPATNQYEAPFKEEDLVIYNGALGALKELINSGLILFLVSNQPDYAKGKTSLENLLQVHKKLHSILQKSNINFTEYYYCYHHPEGTIPELAIKCNCRKPGNLFLMKAEAKYGLDLSNSWMIGDRDADIYCGQSAGTKTIMIRQRYPDTKAGQSKPDHIVGDLKEAVEIIKCQI